MLTRDLTTPALLVDADVLDANLAAMAAALPGDRLRPHVKAHKCSALAARQAAAGHRGFTCATIREAEGMAAAGLGGDLLVANEVVDARRLGRLVEAGHRVTLAVDSPATVVAAAAGGVREVLVDVNIGLPRCGVPAEEAGRLADEARAAGLDVRGVMGYEGHAVLLEDRRQRIEEVKKCVALLAAAARDVGGEVISGGGTGTYDLNTVATEIQAGSYALMDTAYAKLGLPFGQALTVLATVISVNLGGGWAVADCGLKALGMDHGNPALADGSSVWFCSDEHLVFSPPEGAALPAVGDVVQVVPAHVDPTVAYHEHLHVVRGDEVVDRWDVDLRGW
ncbi:alanine racemase [Acidiferrimicrobium sp. IK]|uniref:alanine racemase n=1 Tax=Acidiferrimicrobium sp. IK TaxID=2871700 RepID=UPI0021CB6E07|nr:alanine racemase [Acidiferrimicrobium sp. IK]MCU4185578.1 alanine racemase [Acidiferrimicrobium sp. IK]